MNAQLILNFDNQDDLMKILQFLREIGLDRIKVETDTLHNSKITELVLEPTTTNAYQEAQSIKGDVPKPIFSLDKYSVYEQ